MAGNSDYLAESVLNFASGYEPFPSIGSRYLALFTTAPTSDAGTGGTEVSGGSYARVQIAGAIAAGGTWTTSSTSITMGSSNPGWIVAGMSVWDITASAFIGTVSSYSGTTLTLTSTAAHASSGSTDSLQFSAFPAASASSGNEPATAPANVTNGAVITFPASTASWGTIQAFGIYDASTSGNLLNWDYLGNYSWKPFSCSLASPGVITTDSSGDVPANSSNIVVTQKFGGTLPTTGGSWAGLLTTANASSNTFTAGVNTTSVGGGQFRQVATQSIPSGITASFSASTLTLQQA